MSDDCNHLDTYGSLMLDGVCMVCGARDAAPTSDRKLTRVMLKLCEAISIADFLMKFVKLNKLALDADEAAVLVEYERKLQVLKDGDYTNGGLAFVGPLMTKEESRQIWKDIDASGEGGGGVKDREHPNCPSCICGKRARVQGNTKIAIGQPGNGPGTIAWSEHEMAWSAYAAQYGRGQGPEQMHERGGFDYLELADFLGHAPETWVPAGTVAERQR